MRLRFTNPLPRRCPLAGTPSYAVPVDSRDATLCKFLGPEYLEGLIDFSSGSDRLELWDRKLGP